MCLCVCVHLCMSKTKLGHLSGHRLLTCRAFCSLSPISNNNRIQQHSYHLPLSMATILVSPGRG